MDVSSTITRLGFEKALIDARLDLRRAVVAQAVLFREMCEATPRREVMYAQAVLYGDATDSAARAFRTLFSINAEVSWSMAA